LKRQHGKKFVKKRRKMETRNYSIILVITALPNLILAGLNNSPVYGFGIEVGVGHNHFLRSTPCGIKTPGDFVADRKETYFTPTIRVTCLFNLSNKFDMQPFMGYNRFGGKGSRDIYSFDALEPGIFTHYRYANLSFGIGAKIHRILRVRYQRSSYHADRTDWFVEYSKNVGARVSYSFKHISLSLESWFGINDLTDGLVDSATVYENHYRIIVGCYF